MRVAGCITLFDRGWHHAVTVTHPPQLFDLEADCDELNGVGAVERRIWLRVLSRPSAAIDLGLASCGVHGLESLLLDTIGR